MKYFSIIFLILVAFASCDSSKSVVKDGDVAADTNDTLRIANES